MRVDEIKEVRRREGGFTLLDILIALIIMGILMAILATTMTSYISAANTKKFNANLSQIAQSLETQSTANPASKSFSATGIQIPEELKSKTIFVIGTPSDYCVLGTDNSYARKKITNNDFSYKTDGGQQYFIYTPSNSTITQTREIQPSMCPSAGPVTLLNRGE